MERIPPMPPSASPRRLALPLSLSLVAHAFLLGLISFLPDRSSISEPPSADARPSFSIGLVSCTQPTPHPRIEPVPAENDKEIFVSVGPEAPPAPRPVPGSCGSVAAGSRATAPSRPLLLGLDSLLSAVSGGDCSSRRPPPGGWCTSSIDPSAWVLEEPWQRPDSRLPPA